MRDNPTAPFDGLPLAGGQVLAPAWVERGNEPVQTSNAGSQEARLHAAIQAAASILDQARRDSGPDAEPIVFFQLSILKAPELFIRASDVIFLGGTAEQGWSQALDAEIAHFAESRSSSIASKVDDYAAIKAIVVDCLIDPESYPRAAPQQASIFIGETLRLDMYLRHRHWMAGIATCRASWFGHVAMLARAAGIPFVSDLPKSILDIEHGSCISLDGDAGRLSVSPQWSGGRRVQRIPAQAIDFIGKGWSCSACINDMDLGPRLPDSITSVGLVRTELLFSEAGAIHDQSAHQQRYRRILTWAEGRTVAIRLLDITEDKPLAGLPQVRENMPEGMAYLLQFRRLLEVQLRALLLSTHAGPLQILLPNVRDPAEVADCRTLVSDLASTLGVPVPPVGMMIETLETARRPDAFAADFHLVGTNDLMTRSIGLSRNDSAMRVRRSDAIHATLLLLDRFAMPALRRSGLRPIAACGELAEDAAIRPELARLGFEEFCLPVEHLRGVGQPRPI